MSGDRVTFYRDKVGEWRWSVTAPNGKIIAASSESFTRRWSARRNYRRVMGR